MVTLLAMVVMRIPTVALIRGLGSPTAEIHSDLMKPATSAGNLVKCALTLFLRMSPDKDLVASSSEVIFVRT